MATAAAKRTRALVFPGQGSQRVGMAKDLLENWRHVTSDVLDEASEAIQFNLRTLMTDGPQEQLTETQYAQPAILSHSIAVLRILQQEQSFKVAEQASFVMGHSLGEYSALVAADAMAFSDAVRLVHFRGQAMQRAVPRGAGAMAALMPVAPLTAEEICTLASVKTDGLVCQVANYNSSKQSVISGATAAVEAAIEIAKRDKKVRRAVLLDVSAPFHCALMEPAALELELQLAQEMSDKIHTPAVPVVWNVEGDASAKPSSALIRESLVRQVTSPVRWSQSVDFCVNHGVESFVELGFGGVLTALIKQHAPKTSALYAVATAICTSCGTADELRAFLNKPIEP